MYVSRMSFYTRPGHTEEVAKLLRQLADMVGGTGRVGARAARLDGIPGAPDLLFEQEVESLADLERGIHGVTDQEAFQKWSGEVTELLLHPPKREILMVEA